VVLPLLMVKVETADSVDVAVDKAGDKSGVGVGWRLAVEMGVEVTVGLMSSLGYVVEVLLRSRMA